MLTDVIVGQASSSKVLHQATWHNIQQWRKYLGSSHNKTSIRFLVEEWKLPKYREKLCDK